ncbi:transposable element Tcb2 transposase [Trichonephila clavipes]|nr:transposable element Tcb2 transposase [Trichonephila clavipes]
MGLQFLFMDDNAPCHRTVAAEQPLESEDIERMDWPARSPDLNPIEHVWDFLGRRLAARTLPPVTIRELRLALQDEWAAMPQQLIDTLILSMGRRCETCLAVREIISPTKDRMFLAGHPSQGCFAFSRIRAPCYFFNQASLYPSDFSFKEFGTVIEDDDDTNINSEKELSFGQKLELAITQKISTNQNTGQKAAVSKTIGREIDLSEDEGFRGKYLEKKYIAHC